MLKKFLKNCKKPEGKFGEWVVKAMNKGHQPLSLWAFDVCPLSDGETVLDVGCGGGGNLLRILERCPNSRVEGIDYSEESVACSRKTTGAYADRCGIVCGDAMQLPYPDETFDRAVSFESIYFWPDPLQGLKEMFRILKVGGKVMLASEMTDPFKGKFWAKRCEGMTIYTEEQLASFLSEAGFSDVKVHKTRKVWCAVEGVKRPEMSRGSIVVGNR